MLKTVIRYDIYLCRRCLEEHICYQYQETADGIHYENEGKLFNEIPKKCKFCGYKSLALGSYHRDDDYENRYLTSPEYKAYEKLREEIQHQPEFDPVRREKLIASRRAKSAARSAANVTPIRTSANVPKCPTCGSTDIKDISTLNRMVSVGAFGLASDKIGKTKKCKNCGYKW